jgi:hypothetical protein
MPIPTPSRRALASLIVAVGLVAVLASWAPEHSRTYTGSAATIGKGSVESYVILTATGAPAAVGVHLTEGALEQLPVHKNRRSRCFDLNSDANIAASECVGDEERILQLPAEIVARAQLPFRWISVNWNAEGHHPPPPKPGEAPAPPIYARPHFDFHFYAWDRDRIEAIAPGRCGEFVDCRDFERGRKPIPARYVPEGHVDVGIVVPRMGNHLLDSRSPELVDPSTPFTRTFIFGAFDSELIFWEPMITFDFLRRTSDACFEIRQPAAYRKSGYYPTQYCIRTLTGSNQHTVSLEGFVYAEAS